MGYYWLLWLGFFFLCPELYAAFFTPKKEDTFSEFIWRSFGLRGPKVPFARTRRVILNLFLFFFWGHMAYQWSVIPLAVTGAGVGSILLYAVAKEKAMKENYSYLKTVKKGMVALGELLLSIVISMLPQFVDHVLAAIDETHEVEALGIPVAWVPAVLVLVRMFSNWWKNRK